jgi:ribosomal protein S18 acetylase RimI-like enzyme
MKARSLCSTSSTSRRSCADEGLGSALLTTAEAVTRQRGGELLEINVDGDDTDARRFYERHGYVNSEPGEDQPLLYYYRELGDAS